MRDLKNIENAISIVSDFLGNERDEATKSHALAFAQAELSKRPSIDENKLKYRLETKKFGIAKKYSFFEKCLIPDIQNGKYDGIAEIEKTEKKPPLSSTNFYKAMDEIGVKDDVDRILIDYYIDAVWEQSDITIEEVRHFTGKAIEWMKSLPEEKRKTSVLLEFCKRSSTLSKYLSREKAMEKVQEWMKENERLDDELDAFYDSICGGESDD